MYVHTEKRMDIVPHNTGSRYNTTYNTTLQWGKTQINLDLNKTLSRISGEGCVCVWIWGGDTDCACGNETTLNAIGRKPTTHVETAFDYSVFCIMHVWTQPVVVLPQIPLQYRVQGIDPGAKNLFAMPWNPHMSMFMSKTCHIPRITYLASNRSSYAGFTGLQTTQPER